MYYLITLSRDSRMILGSYRAETSAKKAYAALFQQTNETVSMVAVLVESLPGQPERLVSSPVPESSLSRDTFGTFTHLGGPEHNGWALESADGDSFMSPMEVLA